MATRAARDAAAGASAAEAAAELIEIGVGVGVAVGLGVGVGKGNLPTCQRQPERSIATVRTRAARPPIREPVTDPMDYHARHRSKGFSTRSRAEACRMGTAEIGKNCSAPS